MSRATLPRAEDLRQRHRNPDTDSIAAAVGYAELKNRLDPENEYVPVRLGDLNAQTEWVLAQAGAEAP